MPDLAFPNGFLWGAATSAHQIEGENLHSDWWAEEQAGRLPYASGRAADSWNRWEEDLDLAVSLGLNTYRISCEWARIEPRPGAFDDDAIARYVQMLRGAKERGLTTVLVLWHFTNPLWVAEQGGWESRDTPARFEAYVRRVVPAFAPHVDLWATLNEPNTLLWLAYVDGQWPPFARHSWHRAWDVMNRFAEGHRRAYAAIKDLAGDSARVGLTILLLWYHPKPGYDGLAAPIIALWRWSANRRLVDLVRGELDWLGVQYYYDTPIGAFGSDYDAGTPPRTDMGWRIEPRGLYEVIMQAAEQCPRTPLYVTENGLADAADAQRGRFILDHLAWVHRAIEDGADVRGYLYWSLLDNFEWAEGYGPRFGLVAVDYETFARTPRPSASLYAEIARSNRVTEAMGEGRAYADGTVSLGPR